MTYLEPVSPYGTQRRKYKPLVGHQITLDLPGERVRAEITGVANDDAVVCKVLSTPIAKTPHGVVKDDMVCARRSENSIGMECWSMITEREMQQRDQIARFEEEERAKVADAEKARVAQIHADDLAAQAAAATVVATKSKKKGSPRVKTVKAA